MIYVVGDIHGEWGYFNDRMKTLEEGDQAIILGDVGIGFAGNWHPPKFQEGVKFIRGNHDNPTSCRNHPDYLGDYGVINNMGFVSGGWSIDREWRTEGKNWWPDEELTIESLYTAYDLFKASQPTIMLTHECPGEIAPYVLKGQIYYPTRTSQFLDVVAKDITSIKYWFFGHYHESFYKEFNGTQYMALDCHEFKSLEGCI